jgi:hypothetical protein
MSGTDLDIPGSEDDVRSEDEENNCCFACSNFII